MKNLLLIAITLLAACQSSIKDEKQPKELPQSDSIRAAEDVRPVANTNTIVNDPADLIGYWVGWFIADISDSAKDALYDAGIQYSNRNKINISIDSIAGTYVKGHSVVANNNRPFEGELELKADIYTFRVKEPGDDKHDGQFLFQIAKGDSVVKGYWESYRAANVKRRKYSLEKAFYAYDSSVVLDGWYMDMEKMKYEVDTFNLEKLTKEFGTVNKIIEAWFGEDTLNMTEEDKEQYLGWIKEDMEMGSSTAYSVTEKVFEYNASSQKLPKEYAENLTKADIFILRNSIYARHGYSFKDRKLREYFDWQDWYIPVHAYIKADITDLEKENIALLLKYEEHAEEYYDEFGR
ncbi:MAG: hypothetical protein RLZZ337_1159 [Bacteroidota bacterium]|jgi:hypothetical protein